MRYLRLAKRLCRQHNANLKAILEMFYLGEFLLLILLSPAVECVIMLLKVRAGYLERGGREQQSSHKPELRREPPFAALSQILPAGQLIDQRPHLWRMAHSHDVSQGSWPLSVAIFDDHLAHLHQRMMLLSEGNGRTGHVGQNCVTEGY